MFGGIGSVVFIWEQTMCSVFGCLEKNWYVLNLGVLDVNYHICILVGFIEKKNEIRFLLFYVLQSVMYTLSTW